MHVKSSPEDPATCNKFLLDMLVYTLRIIAWTADRQSKPVLANQLMNLNFRSVSSTQLKIDEVTSVS